MSSHTCCIECILFGLRYNLHIFIYRCKSNTLLRVFFLQKYILRVFSVLGYSNYKFSKLILYSFLNDILCISIIFVQKKFIFKLLAHDENFKFSKYLFFCFGFSGLCFPILKYLVELSHKCSLDNTLREKFLLFMVSSCLFIWLLCKKPFVVSIASLF